MSIEDLNKKDLFIHLASIGFTLGVFGCGLISAVIATLTAGDGSIHFCNPEFLEMIGDPTLAILLQVLAEGLYGVIAFGGTFVYYIEEWGMMKATLSHFLMLSVSFFLMAYFLKWYTIYSPTAILVFSLCFVTAYALIWFLEYLSYKSQIKKINDGLTRLKEEGM